METDDAILVEDLSKAYRIWADPAARLKSPALAGLARLCPGASARAALARRAAAYYRDFFALTGISFQVRRGESVGIIGRNGSGKSTLLQIIAGTLQPTSGRAEVQGRVAALLELGSGFNPDFTGRENVHLNAAILGLTRGQIEARFEEIAAFADIGDFIDQPVKTYSSGMLMRLAFAVQTAVEPDILIIDEALSVGDIFFSQKCMARMRTLRETGTTILFVSHDLGSVRDLCQRTLYLRQGRAEFWGETQQAISRYHSEGRGAATPLAATPKKSNSVEHVIRRAMEDAFWIRPSDSVPAPEGMGRWLAVKFTDEQGVPLTKFKLGTKMRITGAYECLEAGNFRAAVEIKNRHDHIVNSTGCYTAGLPPVELEPGDCGIFEATLDLNLEAGRYTCQLVLGEECGLPNRGRRLDMTPWLGPIEIDWDYENERAPFLGMFGLPATVVVTRSDPIPSKREAR